MEANPAMGPDLLAAIDKYYDNSLEVSRTREGNDHN